MTAAVGRRSSTTVKAKAAKAPPSGGRSRGQRGQRGRRSDGQTARQPGRRTSESAGQFGGLRLFSRSELRARARLRGGLAALCLLIVGGFFSIAFVQAQLVAGQQDLDQMRSQLDEIKKERAQLAQEVDQASAPEAIVARAHELGMVRATEPIYLAAVSPAPKILTPAFVAPADDRAEDLVAAQVSPQPSMSSANAAKSDEAKDEAKPVVVLTVDDPSTASPLAGSTAVVVGLSDG